MYFLFQKWFLFSCLIIIVRDRMRASSAIDLSLSILRHRTYDAWTHSSVENLLPSLYTPFTKCDVMLCSGSVTPFLNLLRIKEITKLHPALMINLLTTSWKLGCTYWVYLNFCGSHTIPVCLKFLLKCHVVEFELMVPPETWSFLLTKINECLHLMNKTHNRNSLRFFISHMVEFSQ